MQSFKAGFAAAVTVPLVGASGEALVPTALRWRLLDELDAVLLDWAAVALPGAGETSVALTIPAPQTTLATGQVSALRQIELEVTDAAGVRDLQVAVRVAASTVLQLAANSFQTYGQAALIAAELPSLAGWSASERGLQELALAEAFSRIGMLDIRIEYSDSQSVIRDVGSSPPRVRDLTAAQLAILEPRLLLALRRAQVLEADEILSGDEVARARHQGLISMTVGESSQFFRTAKPLNLPINPRAMQQLQRWVRFGARIGRA